jgi:cyclomaltodextrin glucanotransferase
MIRRPSLSILALATVLALPARAQAPAGDDLYGTLEPFASQSIYFVVTDRFVNGDRSNDHRDQGGKHRTFDIPTPGAPAGSEDNIGYLGGDFKGIVDNAGYIHDMGFSAVWVTPIVDNPDEAFTGGKPVTWGSTLTDQGKTGYHGYWGVNFYRLDEHLPSKGLDFAGFTQAMKGHQLDVVLDIVANHGSPAFSMPTAQPKFGQIFDKSGRKLADHQNLAPDQLDPQHNPMHAFYNTGGGLAELSDLAEANPAVLDYLAGAYEQWIGQGAAAFRVDTIAWMPHSFWKQFAERIRARHPGFFMFGEAFDYDAAFIAGHTLPRNGHYSVLDFPQRGKLSQVFGKTGGGYQDLERSLYLEDGPYANPYDLVTFYDNHDMARLDATDAGFIDANNWLFTARGIPAIYYGSETGFMRGAAEHAGNRNYYGQARIDAAGDSAIYRNLKRIANLRRASIALQRGLQFNLKLKGDTAAFYRVYEHDGKAQTALVLLNKSDAAASVALDASLQPGTWRDGLEGTSVEIGEAARLQVPAHGVRVLFYDRPLTNPLLRAQLAQDMAHRLRD